MRKIIVLLFLLTAVVFTGCSDFNFGNVKDNITENGSSGNVPSIPDDNGNGTTNPDDNENGSTNPGDNENGSTNPDDNETGTTNPGDNETGTTNPDDNETGTTNPDDNETGTTNPDDNETIIPEEKPAYDKTFDYSRQSFNPELYYGRSLLQTEDEKRAYDLLLKTILNYDTENADKMTKMRIYINFYDNGIKVTYNQLLKIGRYLFSDDPRMPLLSSLTAPRGADRDFSQPATVGGYVKEAYYDARFLGSLQTTYNIYRKNIDLIEVEVKRILDMLDVEMNEAQKIRLLHDEIVSLISYGIQSVSGSGGTLESLIKNERGAFPAVCQGYAKALQYVAYRAGIPAIYVTGIATYSGSVDHAWNMVKIENQWYNIDPTNDDPPTGASVSVRHIDFLQSDSDFNHDHTAGISTSPDVDADTYGGYPATAPSSYPLDATVFHK